MMGGNNEAAAENLTLREDLERLSKQVEGMAERLKQSEERRIILPTRIDSAHSLAGYAILKERAGRTPTPLTFFNTFDSDMVLTGDRIPPLQEAQECGITQLFLLDCQEKITTIVKIATLHPQISIPALL